MRNYLKILFFLLPFCLFGQDRSIDSLKLALKNAKHDTTRCYLLMTLIEQDYDDKVWPLYNQQLFAIANKNLSSKTNKALNKIYLYYFANAINNIGYLAQEHGDISKALEYYYSALKIQEQINNTEDAAMITNNIAYIYMSIGNIDKAMELLNTALAQQQKINNTEASANLLNSLGYIYSNRANGIEKALMYFNESLKIHRKINNKDGISSSLSNNADMYLKQGDTLKAIEYHLSALNIREEIKDPAGISYELNCLGVIMFKLGRINEALKYAKKSFNIAKEINYVENIRDASLTLYNTLKKQNKNQESLEMFELYIRMRDSISNQETRKASIKSQLKYEYEKKAAADSVIVAEEKKLTTVKLKQEQTQRYYLYCGLCLTALFGIFMFNRFRITQKQKNVIEEQKTLVETQKHIVDEKQKEILDSIRYAKRIQQSLLPTEKFIERILKKNSR